MSLRLPMLILLLCASLILSSCLGTSAVRGDDTLSTDLPEETVAVPEDALLLFDGTSLRLSVIVSEFASKTVRSAALTVVNSLTALASGSASMKFTEDFSKDEAEIRNAKNEVLVGLTNRPVSVETNRELLPDGSYSVEISAERVILTGINDQAVKNAAAYFSEIFLPSHILRIGDAVYLLPGIYRAPATDMSFIGYAVAYDRIGKTFGYQTEKVLDIPGVPDTAFNIQQGACFDAKGKYGYFVLRDKNDNCSLVKYDLTTGEMVASSLDIGCDHGNDACFNPDNNTVVISHCTQNPTLLSVFDADTLELIRRVDTGYSNSAVAYCPSRGLYVMMGGGHFRYLDADFKLVEQHATRVTPYTSQGIHCDDHYIYRVESSSSEIKGNVIEIYDWDGNYVMMMNLPDISPETETMAHLGKDLYVICYAGKKQGGCVYKMTVEFD